MARKAKRINLKRLNDQTESCEEKNEEAKRSKGNDFEFDDDELIEKNMKMRLGDDFYAFDVFELSKRLLGKYLVRVVAFDDSAGKRRRQLLVGKIVETEAYHADDEASHSYQMKQTDRNRAMFMKAGTAYVYNCYGMYACFNVSSQESGGGVLVRALEPVHGLETMRRLRCSSSKSQSMVANMKTRELTNGPSKLCLSFNITKNEVNTVDLCTSDVFWIQQSFLSKLGQEELGQTEMEIYEAKRIGIESAGSEAVNKLYRYYIRGNEFVSVRDVEDKKPKISTKTN